MSLITCGLAGEGVVASVVPFSTVPYLTTFEDTLVEELFEYQLQETEFTTEIPVVEFEIDIIRIEECSWPPV